MKRIVSVLTLLAVIIGCIGIGLGTVSAAGKDFTLEMQIGNPKMSVNGEQLNIDEDGTVPLIVNERTLVPVRAIIESMGGTVEWDSETRTAALNYGGDRIELVIDSETAYLNGAPNELDAAPAIINDRTMLPIRFIAESFGFDVGWDGPSKTITISNKETTDTTAVTEAGLVKGNYNNGIWRE